MDSYAQKEWIEAKHKADAILSSLKKSSRKK
jgi:hypothetical protein